MQEADAPFLHAETGDFAVVWKPPRMHCAPLKDGEGGTLLEWYAALFPPALAITGRKKGEGGLVHRLDFETRGLVLFAKNQKTLDFLLARQDEGAFVKEYEARSVQAPPRLPGFPPPPAAPDCAAPGFPAEPVAIKSFFRPFGPGRKQVRPVTGAAPAYREIAKDGGGYYRTEIRGVAASAPFFDFALTIQRGFRHQIRCHLAWIGYPILNDPLYGTGDDSAPGAFLALSSSGLVFPDPRSGERREYRVRPLLVNKRVK